MGVEFSKKSEFHLNQIASFNESETEDSDSDMEQAEQLLTLYEDYIEKS